MGTLKHLRMLSCWIILLYFSCSIWLTEGYSKNVEVIYENNFEYDYTSILDTNKDSGQRTDWTILDSSQGFPNWFEYFNNTSEIPEDVDYGCNYPYEVGFPRNFSKEPFLNESDANGIWMMVHAIYPPNYEDPVAHIDFLRTNPQDFDTISITCYLSGKSSLKFIITVSGNSIITRSFNNSLNPKEDWDTFSINTTTPFKKFTLEIYAEDNVSFVMVEKMQVSKRTVPTTTTTPAPVYCTTPQEDISSSTTKSDETTTTLTDTTNPTISDSTANNAPDIKKDYSAGVHFQYDYTSILDTKDDSSGLGKEWIVSDSSQGFPNWFEYFNNISEIPGDKDFGGVFPYEVGFPRNFTKEPFLNESDADGIWMMVHAIYPPNFDDPVAHIDFHPNMTPLREFDTINITCYLNGESSLVVTVTLQNNEATYKHTFDNDLNQTSKDDWDIFLINSVTPFKKFKLEIYAENNSSFVMVEKIVVGKRSGLITTFPPRPTTTAISATTGSSSLSTEILTTKTSMEYSSTTTSKVSESFPTELTTELSSSSISEVSEFYSTEKTTELCSNPTESSSNPTESSSSPTELSSAPTESSSSPTESSSSPTESSSSPTESSSSPTESSSSPTDSSSNPTESSSSPSESSSSPTESSSNPTESSSSPTESSSNPTESSSSTTEQQCIEPTTTTTPTPITTTRTRPTTTTEPEETTGSTLKTEEPSIRTTLTTSPEYSTMSTATSGSAETSTKPSTTKSNDSNHLSAEIMAIFMPIFISVISG